MATFNGIEIMKELRPCIVNEKGKALFHMWEECSDIVAPSPMVGGHSGGTLKYVMGIVEDKNGRVYRVSPTSIRFVDNKIQDIAFCENGSSHRDTPRKIKYKTGCYGCPECGKETEVWEEYTQCPKCGQLLDWEA